MNPEEFCRDHAAPPGSNLYYATLYHPVAERRRLHALFALCLEVEETVHEARDPGLVRLKLEWWRNELAQIHAETRQHPISAELQELAGRPESAIDTNRLDGFIQALMDHWQAPAPENYEAWIDSRQGSYGDFWCQAAAACGVAGGGRSAVVARGGALLGAFGELCHLAPGLAAGRCIVPVREMNSHGMTIDQLSEDPAAAAPLLGDLLRRLGADLRAQDRLLARSPLKRLLCCRVMVRLAAVLCAELLRDPVSLLHKRTALTPVRKLWIAWRTKL